ncbi:MAG: hypothetical protein ACXWT4_08025 [Methylobacter sp.]
MIIQDLQKRYDVLNNPGLFDTKLEFGLSLPMSIIEDEFAFGFEEAGLDAGKYIVPSAIKQLCCLHNGFSVKWHYLREIEKSYPVMGFTSYPDSYGFVMQNIVHEGKRLFLFDDFLDMWKVYIQLTDGEKRHKLYYFNLYEKKIYPMCITADAYIDKAALCRGLTNWQEFFFDDRHYESDEGNRVRFRKELTTIFPDVTFEEFIQI